MTEKTLERNHKSFKIQLKDVYGEFSSDFSELINPGMIAARQIDPHINSGLKEQLDKCYKTICPVWHDKLQYKSKTIICKPEEEDEVIYWITYVEGGLPTERKVLDNGRIALRADYQAW